VSRLAIFDCDGTLVDSGATIYAALAETLTLHGIAVPDARVCRRVIGMSLVEAIGALTPDLSGGDHFELAETYKSCFLRARSEGRVEEPLFDGVLELLDRLESDGWRLAVATGKSDRGLKSCLDSHGIHARFVSLQTSDRHPSKPHPSMALQAIADAGADPAASIVVGDTSFDMGMAVAAGAAGIGAAWGYHEAEDLLAAGAIGVAETPLGVLEIIPAMEARHG
jgi:phosphoglycolate phosphatase